VTIYFEPCLLGVKSDFRLFKEVSLYSTDSTDCHSMVILWTSALYVEGPWVEPWPRDRPSWPKFWWCHSVSPGNALSYNRLQSQSSQFTVHNLPAISYFMVCKLYSRHNFVTKPTNKHFFLWIPKQFTFMKGMGAKRENVFQENY